MSKRYHKDWDDDFQAVSDGINFRRWISESGLMVKTGVPRKKLKKILAFFDSQGWLNYNEQGSFRYGEGDWDAGIEDDV